MSRSKKFPDTTEYEYLITVNIIFVIYIELKFIVN
jgi:hypothetical protein